MMSATVLTHADPPSARSAWCTRGLPYTPRSVGRLATDLGVNVRHQWRPDAAWLAGYQKAQLVHLAYVLRGPAHGPAAERKKKSELVAELAQLFADAAEGTLPDAALAERLNAWMPGNLRDAKANDDGSAAAAPSAAP